MKALVAFGWAVAAFGTYAAVMVLTNLAQQTSFEITVRFLCSAGLAAAGVFGALRARRLTPWLDAREAERNVLRVASAHRGHVTATEVAAESPVPLAQANKILEALTSQGACRMAVAESGILVFEFPGLDVSEQPATESERQAVTPRVNIEH